MPAGTYVIEVDWSDDGSFTGSDVVTSTTLGRAAVVIDRGVDTDSLPPLGGLLATAIDYELQNDDSEYHPANTGSALFGNLGPGRDTRIRTTTPSAVGLGRGRIEDFRVNPNPGAKSVEVSAFGGLGSLVGSPVTVALQAAITTGDAIGLVLDAAGWPAGRRNLDTGGTVIRQWFVNGQDPTNALRELLLSEGPGAALFEDGDGDIVFHDRHHRLTNATSKTSQATLRDTGTEPVYLLGHTYRQGYQRVVNRVEITPKRYLNSATKVLWELPQPFVYLTASSSVTLVMELEDPAVSLVTPVIDEAAAVFLGIADPDTDIAYDELIGFPVSDSDITTSFDVQSGPRIELTITNNNVSSPTLLRKVRVRGITAVGVVDGQETTIVEDATSQALFGVRTLRLEDVWMDANTAADIAAVLVNDYKNPTAVVSVTLSNGDSTRFTQALTREVNDRITVTESGSGLSDEFYIDRVTHVIEDAGQVHQTTFTAVAVGTPLVAAGDVFILDDATQKLGTGKLGY